MATQFETMQKPLYLTEDEAMALLDMCLLTTAEDTIIRAQTMDRVGDLCRRFLQTDVEPVERVVACRPRLPMFRGAACALRA